MSDVALLLTKWRESLTRGKDFDTWGQFVEASEEYSRLSRQIFEHVAAEHNFFNEEQKKVLGKVAACLQSRSRFFQNLESEEISLEDIRQLCLVLGNFLSEKTEDFPVTVPEQLGEKTFQTNNNLIIEEVPNDQEGTKEFGSLLPRIFHEVDCHRLTIKIVKIGLKDPSEFINPFITVSVKALDGADITTSQNTPTAKTKENRNIHFDCNVELQTTIEKLPPGAAIFFEFKHFKPKKKQMSTKCWTFMEMDEIKAGPACLELKDHVIRELQSQKKWTEQWGYLFDEYQKLQENLLNIGSELDDELEAKLALELEQNVDQGGCECNALGEGNALADGLPDCMVKKDITSHIARLQENAKGKNDILKLLKWPCEGTI